LGARFAQNGLKANFTALEIFKGGEWINIGNPEDHAGETHPLSVEPIADQVARIQLPDTRIG
jgi:arginine-tRNA-protein transferase